MAYDPFFFGFAERVVGFFADFLTELFFFTADLRSADIFVRVFAALLFVVAGPFFAAPLRADFRAGAASSSASSDSAAALRAVFRARVGFSAGSRSAIGSSVWPIAPASIITTSDHRMW